jgi:hypothetical protein
MVLLLASACDRGPVGERAPKVMPTLPQRPVRPTTREAFLAELSPLPAETVRVVYEVRGPADTEGTLEVLLAPGGRRRENWRMRTATADGERVVEGSSIQTPDHAWQQTASGVHVSSVPLGRLADAFLALDDAQRDAVIATLRAFHVRARVNEPTQSVETIADTPCVRVEVASQRLCVWRSTGLPLAYEGGGFSLQAIRVESDVPLGASAFVVPDPPDGAAAAPFDPAPWLAALARGQAGPVAPWLHPGLRLPGPRV